MAVLAAAGVLASCQSPPSPQRKGNETSYPLRVACAGDSITYGAGVEDRARNCYPAVLGRMLGPNYEVANFGANGATLLRRGDRPYRALPAYRQLVEFAPHVIILMLGTNDTKPENWQYRDEFKDDLRDLLDGLAALPTRPEIRVCLPVPVFGERWGISGPRLEAEVIPLLREVTREKRVPVIDLHAALRGRPQWFPDQVHPNAVGAAMIAQAVRYDLMPHR